MIQNLGTFGIPSYNEIEKLTYLKDFLQEVLRLYTPGKLPFLLICILAAWLHHPFSNEYTTAPATWREAAKDVTICGQFLPKGTQIVLSPPVTNLSPRIWGPDVMKFIPERWESLKDDAATPYATQTFGNGPRICIGKSYSLLAFKVMMIELLRNFRFSRSPQLEAIGDGPVPVQNPAVTWRPKGGMTVHLEKITWS